MHCAADHRVEGRHKPMSGHLSSRIIHAPTTGWPNFAKPMYTNV